MNALKIAWRDISKIFKNRIIRVSVIAIIVVPLLYSMLYLAAFWDPYSRLQGMPIAVVNMDRGASLEEEKVNFGDDIVDKLRDNPKVGWQFVSKDVAEEGTKGDKYYAEFIIPEDFTEKLIKARDGKPEQPEILFRSNEKRNFLAAQINRNVLAELKGEIIKSITGQYTEVAFNSLYEVRDGLQQAADGSSKLNEGIVKAEEGSKALSEGMLQLKGKLPELISGVRYLTDGSDRLKLGLAALSGGSGTFSSKLGEAVEGSRTLDYGAQQLKDGLVILNDGVNTKARDESGKPLGLMEGTESLYAGSLQLEQGLNTTEMDSKGNPLGLKAGADFLYAGALQLSQGLNSTYTDANGNPLGLKSGIYRVYEGLTHDDADPTKDGIGPSMKNLQGVLDAYKATGNQTYMDQAQMILTELVRQTNENSKDPAHPTFLDGLTSMKAGVASVAQGSEALLFGAKGVRDGVSKTADAVKYQLVPGAEGVKNGVDQVSYALQNKLVLGAAQLTGGTSRLTEGLEVAAAGSKQLSSGVEELYSGSLELNAGMNTLNASTPELSQGVNDLSNGSSGLYSGMQQISSGSKELSSKLAEGFRELKEKLVNDSKTMGDFVSQPIAVSENAINPVKNYGTGFTPYFIPLSLWVGALMMFFVISDKVDEDINASKGSIVIGKFLSYGYIGTIQAVLASAIVLALGLKPQSIPLYFLFNIFMSFVFIAIIQSLIFLMGDAGRLLAIILLILQLTASAGTFPLEVVPDFFKVLNPFMPFTYSVSALREIISGVDYSVLLMDVSILGGIMAVFLIISVLMKGHADKLQARIKEKKGEMGQLSN